MADPISRAMTAPTTKHSVILGRLSGKRHFVDPGRLGALGQRLLDSGVSGGRPVVVEPRAVEVMGNTGSSRVVAAPARRAAAVEGEADAEEGTPRERGVREPVLGEVRLRVGAPGLAATATE